MIRRIRGLNVRLLVLDTDGINVWCSASEGQFSHTEILKQLDRYERGLLTNDHRLVMILPKLCLAGVNLRALRRANIQPIIGPIYAKDLSTYLSQSPFKDRVRDQVIFGMQSRLYTWLPGLVQCLGYSFAILPFSRSTDDALFYLRYRCFLQSVLYRQFDCEQLFTCAQGNWALPAIVRIASRSESGSICDYGGSQMIALNQETCIGCGICENVCPHRVIEIHDKKAWLAFEERCIECGACQLNCSADAIEVTKGTGCLFVIIKEDILKLEPRTRGCGS